MYENPAREGLFAERVTIADRFGVRLAPGDALVDGVRRVERFMQAPGFLPSKTRDRGNDRDCTALGHVGKRAFDDVSGAEEVDGHDAQGWVRLCQARAAEEGVDWAADVGDR